jgi:hypothetical protein
MTMIEAKLGDDWTDFTKYVQPDWGPPFRDPMQPRKTRKQLARIPGPNRTKRNQARRARTLALKKRLEITGGTGNLMVNICRTGTRQAALDKARRARGGDGQTAPKHPNDRLQHYGMRVRLHPEPGRMPVLIGGTARQRACYRRAVARYVA